MAPCQLTDCQQSAGGLGCHFLQPVSDSGAEKQKKERASDFLALSLAPLIPGLLGYRSTFDSRLVLSVRLLGLCWPNSGEVEAQPLLKLLANIFGKNYEIAFTGPVLFGRRGALAVGIAV
jgi:hypothetical protein